MPSRNRREAALSFSTQTPARQRQESIAARRAAQVRSTASNIMRNAICRLAVLLNDANSRKSKRWLGPSEVGADDPHGSRHLVFCAAWTGSLGQLCGLNVHVLFYMAKAISRAITEKIYDAAHGQTPRAACRDR